MIRFGARLAASTLRAAPLRSLLAVLGASVAVLLLYGALSIEPALERQRARERLRSEPVDVAASPSSSPLLWAPAANTEPLGHHGHLMTIAVAATGRDAPRPLGARRAPANGDVLVSPALERLLERDENAVYRLRIPGQIVGTLTPEVLVSPDDLVMMVGWDAEMLRRVNPTSMVELHGVPTEAAPRAGQVADLRGRLLNVVLGLALLIPVLVFIRIAGRVADTRRRARLAALDLIGASPMQLRTIAATEVALLSLLSLAVAAVVSAGYAAVASELRVAGAAFFVDDLRPPWWQAAGVGVLLPLLSYASVRRGAATSSSALRRAANEVRHPWVRLLPAVAGAALLVAAGDSSEVTIAVGLALLLLGCVLAAPLAMAVATAFVRRVGRDRPVPLLAGGGLRAYALSRARASTGVAAAVLAGTMAAVYFPSHDAWQRSADAVLVTPGSVPVDAMITINGGGAADAELLRALSLLEGIEAVVAMAPVVDGAPRPFASAVLGDCGSLSKVLADLPCSSGVWAAEGAASDELALTFAGGGRLSARVDRVEPALHRLFPRVDYVAELEMVVGPVSANRLLVGTDGTVAAAERLRGWLADHRGPDFHVTAAGSGGGGERSRNEQDYAKVQLLTLFLAAVATLSVALAQGTTILERRRDLSLLLATGVPSATLRRSALVEALAPIVTLAVAACACGAAIASAVLASVGIPVRVSWADVGFVVAATLGPAVLAALLVAPLVPRAVEPSALRTE